MMTNALISPIRGKDYIFLYDFFSILVFESMENQHADIELGRNKRDLISQNRYGNNRFSHNRNWNTSPGKIFNEKLFLQNIGSGRRGHILTSINEIRRQEEENARMLLR